MSLLNILGTEPVKSFADCVNVLQTLKDGCIDGIVAGGWIRDKLNGVEPKDLDIFVLGEPDRHHVEVTMMNCDFHTWNDTPHYYGNYENNDMRDDVVGVTKYKERDLDIIIMKQDSPIEVISNFDVSVCQLYGVLNDGKIDVYATADYMEFLDNGTIYEYTNIPTSEDHLDRVRAKYGKDLTPKTMVIGDVVVQKIGVISE